MNFGKAVEALKDGQKVARAGWNGKDMYIYHKPEGIKDNPHDGGTYTRQAYLIMKTAQDKLVPWMASQSDILDEDWLIINDEAQLDFGNDGASGD